MEKHLIWILFIIVLFLGFVIGIAYTNSTISGYTLTKTEQEQPAQSTDLIKNSDLENIPLEFPSSSKIVEIQETQKNEFRNIITKRISNPYQKEQSFEYPKNIETFNVPKGHILPKIDGKIEESEWQDAAVYNIITNSDVTIHMKHYNLQSSNPRAIGCSIYQTNPSYKIPCGRYILMAFNSSFLDSVAFFFDEGDDGWRGSGGYDNVLTYYQEDTKELRLAGEGIWCKDFLGLTEGCPEPACTPWNEKDCWKCKTNMTWNTGGHCYFSSDPTIIVPSLWAKHHSIMDGYYTIMSGYNSWLSVGMARYSTSKTINFYGFVNEDKTQIEIMIPFKGKEFENHDFCEEFCDLSDINVVEGDTLKIFMRVNSEYPPGATEWDPTGWAKLRLLSISSAQMIKE